MKRRPYWTAEEDRRLAILWAAGWSTASIGADIGRGKNAVCGRRQRLGLPERGCPIPALVRLDREQALADAAYVAAILKAA